MCHRHLKDPPASQTSQWVQPSDIIKTHADQLGNSSEGTSNKWRPYLCSSLFRRAPWQIWANCEQQMRSVLSSIVFFSSNFSACLGPWMQEHLESSHPCSHPPHHQQWGWVLHIIALLPWANSPDFSALWNYGKRRPGNMQPSSKIRDQPEERTVTTQWEEGQCQHPCGRDLTIAASNIRIKIWYLRVLPHLTTAKRIQNATLVGHH